MSSNSDFRLLHLHVIFGWKSEQEISSSFPRAHSALKDLSLHQLCGQAYREMKLNRLFPWLPDREMLFQSARDHFQRFEAEFSFLTLFHESIRNLRDGDRVVQNLGTLVVKIAATLEEIADELVRACRNKYGKKPSKLNTVVSNLLGKIEILKPDIRETCRYLSSHSFQSVSPLYNYHAWYCYARSVAKILQLLGDKSDLPALRDQIDAFSNTLDSRTSFLERVTDLYGDYTKNICPVISVRSVVLRAAHLSCLCWVSELDRSAAEFMHPILSEMQQKIERNAPDFIQMNLRLLSAAEADEKLPSVETRVCLFVDFLLGTEKRVALHEELISLLSIFSKLPPRYSELVRRFTDDIKIVVMEASSGFRTNMVRFSLPAKISLMKAEIFLIVQQNVERLFEHSLENEIEALNNGLKFLRTFFNDLSPEDLKIGKQILKVIKEVTREVPSLHHSFHAKEITEERVRDVLLKLLVKIGLFRGESILMELQRSGAMIFVKEQIENLQNGLVFLKGFVIIHSKLCTEDERLILNRIEAVARGVISLYHSSHASEITEAMIREVNFLLHQLLADEKTVKAELQKINLHVPRISFPRTNGPGFVDFLLRNLRELLNHKADQIEPVQHQIEALTGDIELFNSFLKDVGEHGCEHHGLKDLRKWAMDVAYKAEYVVDSIVAGNEIVWDHVLLLFHVSEEIKLIKAQIRTFHDKVYDVEFQSIAQTSGFMISQDGNPRINDVMVGLDDQEEMIIDQLTRGTLQRDIVSIVGMPGIGKTTLATKVYNNPKAMYHFHICAWGNVSQVYRKRELLLDILSDITGIAGDIFELSDEDLDMKLYRSLKNKKYLIILDDMWNIRAWEDLDQSLPNDRNGSRILITSRLQDLVFKAKPESHPHSLRLLSDDESWMLLQKRLFHDEGCPEELLEVGKQIAENCKGLPLAVVAIAGLLERLENEQEQWKQVAENLSSQIVDDPQTRCKDILELSYRDLPDRLKACFLYLGVFLKDRDILIRSLIWLWMAEGFVLETGSKSLEDLAEDCLLDLIGRSLVIVTKRRSNGKVKSCRVHDILHDMCLTKAKEENFFHLISRYNDLSTSSDGIDDGFDFEYYYPSNSTVYEEHRLCIHLKRKDFVMSSPSGPNTHSLLFFASSDKYPRCPYDISFIPQNFKRLRVLDLECINMGNSFPDGTELMLQLRYLAVCGDIESVPSSIANLWNLETFLVKGLKGKVVLPSVIWNMLNLRHLHVSNYATLCLEDDELERSSQLANLVSISTVSFSNGEDANKIMKRLPNLRKLICVYSDALNYYASNNEFLGLDFLKHLESLKIFYSGRVRAPSNLCFPKNVKRLTLLNFRLPWTCISTVGRLPNLEVLKLLSRAFEGNIWEMTEGEFLNLKFLKLDSLDIAQWDASNDHLPNLEHLVLRRCKQLQEIPSAFGEIPTLQVIEVHRCGHSAEESARSIMEEGIEGLKVIINFSDSHFRS